MIRGLPASIKMKHMNEPKRVKTGGYEVATTQQPPQLPQPPPYPHPPSAYNPYPVNAHQHHSNY